MKALVCGGRNYRNKNKLFDELDKLDPDIVIHGDARGADRLAGKWARAKGKMELKFPAEWQKYRRSAGMIRNRRMLEEKPDIVVAFPGGRGTYNMIKISKKAGIRVHEIKGTK